MENHGNNQWFHKQSTKSQDFSTQHYNPPIYCICTCLKVWAAHLSMYTYPKHICTDHPILVYKTCEIEQTVPRLFSCLPLLLSPHKSTYLSQSFASILPTFAFGSITSISSPLLLPTACNKVVSLDTHCLQRRPGGSS